MFVPREIKKAAEWVSSSDCPQLHFGCWSQRRWPSWVILVFPSFKSSQWQIGWSPENDKKLSQSIDSDPCWLSVSRAFCSTRSCVQSSACGREGVCTIYVILCVPKCLLVTHTDTHTYAYQLPVTIFPFFSFSFVLHGLHRALLLDTHSFWMWPLHYLSHSRTSFGFDYTNSIFGLALVR